MRDYRIGVKYKDGVAALSGTVTNQQQLVTAVRLTQGMNGVDQVVNNLTIAGKNLGSPSRLAQLAANFTRLANARNVATRTSYQQPGNQQMRPRHAAAEQRLQQPMFASQMGPQQMNGQ